VFSYVNLSETVVVSHLRFAQPGVIGGIVAFLCGGGNKPACPSPSGTVTGIITATDILAIPNQGLNAGDISSVEKAIAAGDVYANVQSTRFPAGEIRGQFLVHTVVVHEDEPASQEEGTDP
jgi:hypothetical protein